MADDLRDREDDIVWRLRLSRTGAGSEWVYVYLLLEFQSSHNAYMAVRILTYVGLLYQDLIKSGQAGARLPAVFPLVLYNGERPWSAAREIEELIEPMPASLSAYRPRLRYFLMDEGRLPLASLEQGDNAIASLVQLERSASPAEVARVIGQLADKLQAPRNRELRRALTVWIRRLVLRRFAPEGEMLELEDLPEAHHMISGRVESWTQEWLRHGRQQGVQQGLREGQITMLLTLLQQRFGTVPAEIEQRIRAAELERIGLWCIRAVTAQDLLRVFDGH